nr:EamA family transporter RarD [Caulobacter sp. 17J80-11]
MVAGVACYALWGLAPLVYQPMGRAGADAWEIMGHRAVWSVLWAGLLVVLARQGPQVVRVLKTPRVVGLLAVSTVLIAINWTLFVWAVNSGRTLETSLGYYLNPLLNMALGAWMFRERIDRFGRAAIGLAAVGVVFQGVALGHLPWVSLTLAVSFAAYGVIRKKVSAEAQTGLFVECLLLTLPGALYLAWLEGSGQGHFTRSASAAFWLSLAGPMTVFPLVLFSWAARRMPLSTMGFLQFLAPTISFFIGVSQGERFDWLRGVSFAFIWLGAGVFAFGAWRKVRERKLAAAAIEAEGAAEAEPATGRPAA